MQSDKELAPAVATLQSVDTFPPRPATATDAADGSLPGIGARLGNYELTGLLGAGTTSVVYKGRHRKLQIPVAVKVLRGAVLDDSAHLQSKLVSEAVMLARLNHPHIVRLWDMEDEGPFPYLVLEYVHGMSLAELMARRNMPVPASFAFAFIRQAVEGLAQAHSLGIVHRDVKPGNLLLGHDGTVKVADLGLAVVVSQRLARVGAAGVAGAIPAGTAAYLAPEQAFEPTKVDFRADIYSLGCTLYHALTGRLPFEGRSSMEVIMKHLREPPVPPQEFIPSLSPESSELILRMMAKAPEQRAKSYDELRAELGRVVGDRRAPRPLAESFLAFALP